MDNKDLNSQPPDQPVNPADQQERIDFLRSITPKRRRKIKSWMIIAAVVVVLVIAAVAIYLLVIAKPTPHKPSTTNTKSQTSSITSSSNSAYAVPTTPYNSTDFSLSFNYPTTWKVVDSGSGPMTVTSPPMSLTSAAGQSVTGQITMTIAQQGQLPASFSAGTALAVLTSQKIQYAQPASDQDQATYLTFVQYSSTNTKGGLDGVYVTGSYGYQKDQVIPTTDIDKINPLVTLTFIQCATATCQANLTPLTIASTSWSDKTLQVPLVNMIASLVFE